jgi:exopolysaccharide production protein ExoY
MEETTRQERREAVVVYHLRGSSVYKASTPGTDSSHQPSQLYYVSKRIIDIVVSLISIIVLLPIFLIIAIYIKLDDGGDILYFREMVGLRGRHFFMLKFRTMIPNADAYLVEQTELMQEYQQNMKLKQDPRITRVGRFLRKTYLDELPQLFNVLIGQMSLVGPRPIHQRELALYGEYAEKRNAVKPGITGLWQISPDRHKCYEERVPLDMQYINICSFIVDLVILLKTLKVFIVQTGI